MFRQPGVSELPCLSKLVTLALALCCCCCTVVPGCRTRWLDLTVGSLGKSWFLVRRPRIERCLSATLFFDVANSGRLWMICGVAYKLQMEVGYKFVRFQCSISCCSVLATFWLPLPSVPSRMECPQWSSSVARAIVAEATVLLHDRKYSDVLRPKPRTHYRRHHVCSVILSFLHYCTSSTVWCSHARTFTLARNSSTVLFFFYMIDIPPHQIILWQFCHGLIVFVILYCLYRRHVKPGFLSHIGFVHVLLLRIPEAECSSQFQTPWFPNSHMQIFPTYHFLNAIKSFKFLTSRS